MNLKTYKTMKKYTAPQVEVTTIETEAAILAASVQGDYLEGEITREDKILSNKQKWYADFLEEDE